MSLAAVNPQLKVDLSFDFTGVLKTVLGTREFERHWPAAPIGSGALRSLDLLSVFRTLFQPPFFPQQPGRSPLSQRSVDLNLPPPESVRVKVYMFRRRGGEEAGRDGFGFGLDDVPEEELDADQVVMRPKKDVPNRASKRVSTMFGFQEDSKQVQHVVEKLELKDGMTDQELGQKVADYFGFDSDVLRRLLADHGNLRNSLIAAHGITEDVRDLFLRNEVWGGAEPTDKVGASGGAIRPSVIKVLQLQEGDLPMAVAGARMLGLDLSKVTSAELATQIEAGVPDVFKALSEGSSNCEDDAERLFNEGDARAFFAFLKEAYERVVAQEEMLAQVRGEIKRKSDSKKAKEDGQDEELLALRNLLIDQVGTSAHGKIVFKVLTLVADHLRNGGTFLENEIFKRLLANPIYTDTFKGLRAKDVKQRLSKLPEAVRLALSDKIQLAIDAHEQAVAQYKEMRAVDAAQEIAQERKGASERDAVAQAQAVAAARNRMGKEEEAYLTGRNLALHEEVVQLIRAAEEAHSAEDQAV